MKVSNHATQCLVCNVNLQGKQHKYCSRKCMYIHNNNNHQSYLKQQERGLKRKLMLLEMSGNKCEFCGYDKCIASLSFHHKDRKSKKFQLDLRSLSNRKLKNILEEHKKCQLLCLNCHSELHYKENP